MYKLSCNINSITQFKLMLINRNKDELISNIFVNGKQVSLLQWKKKLSPRGNKIVQDQGLLNTSSTRNYRSDDLLLD